MEMLTKTEERIMQVFWKIGKGFVKDVIAELEEDPRPPYTTVSSIVRILEGKGFLGYRAYGKTHEYFPLISKQDYRKAGFLQMVKTYFDGKPGNVLSFMVKEQQLSPKEIEKLKTFIESQK